jgi:mannosyltransferase OCH1-like enzyme
MIYDFKNLRPPATYNTYPPYHKGEYLEEYFFNFYIKNKQCFDETGYTYIPIFWTNVYITGQNKHLIQPYLDALPPKKYFTVSQHDDAVSEKLPPNTLSFEAGGNKDGIPIPLICSQLDLSLCKPALKDIFCSFVGSIIENSLRHKIYNLFTKDPDIYFSLQNWTPQVTQNRFDHFIDITKRSKFALCPRGYGAQSFRVYEVLQLGTIPVIIYDKEWLPFNSSVDWSSFSVLIHENDIHNIKEILLQINDEQINSMLKKGKEVYNNFFTLEKTSQQILKYLQNITSRKLWPDFKSSMKNSFEYLLEEEKTSEWNIIIKKYDNIKVKPPGTLKIPKILHQIWLGGPMPKKEKDCCDKLKNNLPNDWEYILWTEKDISKIANFQNKKAFEDTPNLGQKSDILRLEILNQYGGVYCDTDIILFDQFNKLLDFEFFCGLTYSKFPEIMNSVLGSTPNNNIIKNLLIFDKLPSWKDAMDIIDTTGPYHLTRKIIPQIENNNIAVLPNSFFYPYPNNKDFRKQGENILEYIEPETICCHLWACSWM